MELVSGADAPIDPPIDPGASELAAEADAVPVPEDTSPAAQAAEAQAQAPQPGEVTEEQAMAAAAQHKPMVAMLVDGLANKLLPNWKITKAECDDLTDSFSLALGYWWPDGTLPPKWAATVMAVYSGYVIVRQRRNDDGTWVPRKIITVKDKAKAAPAGEGAQPQAAASSGGFSTQG